MDALQRPSLYYSVVVKRLPFHARSSNKDTSQWVPFIPASCMDPKAMTMVPPKGKKPVCYRVVAPPTGGPWRPAGTYCACGKYIAAPPGELLPLVDTPAYDPHMVLSIVCKMCGHTLYYHAGLFMWVEWDGHGRPD